MSFFALEFFSKCRICKPDLNASFFIEFVFIHTIFALIFKQVKGKLQLERHLSSKGHKHQQKMEKIRKESKENSSINLYVTPVVKSDIGADDKYRTVMTLKKLTGLPLETVNKFIKNLQLEWKSDSERTDTSYCVEGICHSNKFHLQKMQADINCGNYDTSWVKFTTLQPQNLHVIPMDKSDISAND